MASDDSAATGGRALTPQVVGAVLLAVGLAGAVASIAYIPHPLWGIPAAIGLAVASVVFLAGLLTVQRKGWSDKVWPPSRASRPLDHRRVRRTMLGFGIFAIVGAALAGITTLMVGAADVFHAVRGGVLAALLLLIGVGAIVVGTRPLPAPVRSTTRPSRASVQEDRGWTRLGADGSAADPSTWTASSTQLLQVPVFAIILALALSRLSPKAAVGTVAVIAATGVAVFFVLRSRTRAPWVSPGGDSLRRGGRTLRASEITAAQLYAAPRWGDAPQRSLTLILQGPSGFAANVGLRRRGALVLTEAESAVLVELLAQSSITLPRDKDDPTGRFSSTLYPDHLTKVQALDIAEHPPGDGEPLPIFTAPNL